MASAFPPRCRSSGPRAFVGLGPLQEGLLRLVETYVEALPPNARFALQNAGAFDLGNLPRYRALSLGNLPRHRARNPFPQPHELATLVMHELQPPRLAFASLIEAVTASFHHVHGAISRGDLRSAPENLLVHCQKDIAAIVNHDGQVPSVHDVKPHSAEFDKDALIRHILHHRHGDEVRRPEIHGPSRLNDLKPHPESLRGSFGSRQQGFSLGLSESRWLPENSDSSDSRNDLLEQLHGFAD